MWITIHQLHVYLSPRCLFIFIFLLFVYFTVRYSERQSYLNKNVKVHQSFESFVLNNFHPCDTPLGGATPEGTAQPKHSHIRTAESVRDIPSDVTPSLRQRANTFTEGTTNSELWSTMNIDYGAYIYEEYFPSYPQYSNSVTRQSREIR